MTTDERLARLEREMAALQKLLLPETAATRHDLDRLEETFGLTMRSVDVRLAEIAAKEPAASGPALGGTTAGAIVRYVDERLASATFDRIDGETTHLLLVLLRLVQKLAEVLSEPHEPAGRSGVN